MIAEIAIKEKGQIKSYWDENKVYTFDEYFEIVQKVPFKCEFRNGKIIAMPNATNEHGFIIDSLLFYLKLSIKQNKLNARASSSEVRVFIEAINEGLYPDCHITVGEIENFQEK